MVSQTLNTDLGEIPRQDDGDVEPEDESDWDQVGKGLTVDHHILESCLEAPSEKEDSKSPSPHLVLSTQEEPVGQGEAEVEQDVEQEVVPDHFVDAGLPQEEKFPEDSQPSYCGDL